MLSLKYKIPGFLLKPGIFFKKSISYIIICSNMRSNNI